MKLFKNVDICDLVSILEKGILSLDASGNNNWERNKRAGNPTNVVYLFSPTGANNSFVKYGAALLEVDVPDAHENQLLERDYNQGNYTEFTVPKVAPKQIKAVYIPKLFQDWITLDDTIKSKITWCGIEARVFHNGELVPATAEDFAYLKNQNVTCANGWLYFRGVKENNHVVDYIDVNYKF